MSPWPLVATAVLLTNLPSISLYDCSLIARRDLRDIFDQLSVTRKSKITLNSDKSRSAPELFHIPEKRKIGE